MKTVVLCNQLSGLKAILRGIPGTVRYITLVETKESLQIQSYLRERAGAQEIPRAQLLRDRSEDFRHKYIEFIGQVNARNKSLHWWAMPFTNKNPLATALCSNTSQFLVIVELVRSSSEPLVVVTNNSDVADQVVAWGRVEGVKTVNSVKGRRTWKGAVREFTPGAVLFGLVKTIWIWLQVRHLKPADDTQNGHIVVVSLLHAQSLAEEGKYRDVYFGRLLDELRDHGDKPIVFGLLQEQWRDQLPRLKALRDGVPVVPAEAFLKISDLVKCGWESLKAYSGPVRVCGPVEIGGVDSHRLVTRAISEARRSDEFFRTLRVYYCSMRLAQTLHVKRCLYPFENRAWERMLILGIRGASSDTRLVGYQHASVTLSHTNFILGSAESGIVPLPDAIVTTGPVPKEWMEREGNYPPGVFKVACTLRQSRDGRSLHKEPGQRIKKVLVALATSLQEYVDTLLFLEQAFVVSNDYQVRVRPHPTIPLGSALRLAPLNRSDFYQPSTGTLADDLQWADVVLYASSTVGMEAVSLGIPAIYLDVGNYLDTDPMFGWNEFKWSVRDHSELIPTMRKIEAIPQAIFHELQEQGKEYVATYLSPVTPSGLRTFLEA